MESNKERMITGYILGDPMKVKANLTRMNSRLALLWMAAAGISLLYSVPAQADALVIAIQSPLNVNAGDSGDGFDVTLTNDSGSAVSIAAFTFEISTASKDITFTGANTGTVLAPYIFAGKSVFGPNIMVANSGEDLSASDLFSVPASDATLAAGATLALGHILFDVPPSAPTESVTITLAAFPATSLADHLLNNIPITTRANGEIDIAGGTSAVPEPSSLLLLLTAVPLILGGRRLRCQA
jgi:hypothetical protein